MIKTEVTQIRYQGFPVHNRQKRFTIRVLYGSTGTGIAVEN
jgi:hypothetical protein